MALLRTLTCTPGFPLVREAMTFESVANFDAGGIGLFSRARRPIYSFEMPLGILRKAETESLSAFHAFHQGGKPFLWNGGPWGTVENYNLVAEGDGATRLFYLPNRVITAASLALRTFRPSTSATSNWATSSSNSWPFSLSANAGALSFANSSNTIPVSGDDLMAAYACRYLCLFEPGGIKLEQISARGGGLWKGAIKLREIAVNFLSEGVVVPAAAAFSPSDIAGLQLWLKADAITGLNDGDAVTTWSDSSGQGNDVTQATAGNKPTYQTNELNGKPIVRFDGTDDFLMDTSLDAEFQVNSYTFFVVGKQTNAGNDCFFSLGDSLTADQALPPLLAGPIVRAVSFASGGGLDSADSTTTPVGGFRVYSVRRSTADNNFTLWVNGTQEGQDAALANATADYGGASKALAVGARGDTPINFLDGDIAEIIFYDSALSTVNRDSVESYLGSKYNIVVS